LTTTEASGRRAFGVQRGDGHQQLTPMANTGNAQFLKIFGGEMGRHFSIGAILAERRLVSVQAPTLQARSATSIAAP
jgi:hypothetical protein